MHCRRIVEIVLPDTVTEIGEKAFYDCPNLEKVVIPDSVGQIGAEAFANCGSLKTVQTGESVILDINGFLAKDFEIRDGKLIRYRGDLQHVVIPEGVAEIGYRAFGNCRRIESVVIPAGVTRIGTEAFADCKGLRQVSIPDSVKEIGEKAFILCRSLHEVTVPAQVERIGDHALGYYRYLEYIQGLKFPVDKYRKYWDFRIFCAEGSPAELYARENHLRCITQTQ